MQAQLDPLCLIHVTVSPESRVKVRSGPARAELMQQGWRNFLVKVDNKAGVTAELKVKSPNANPLYRRSGGSPEPQQRTPAGEVLNRFLDVNLYARQPINKTLSGLSLEYRVIQLYSRDVGKREARLQFDVGQGTQDLGFRNEASILFNCVPAVEVVLGVKDTDGTPTMASFIIRDRLGRIYPSPSRRLAPDFFFHPQIYRNDGESVMLPPGAYTVEYGRGPEYKVSRRSITVPAGVVSHRETTVFLSILGISWFWFFGTIMTVQLPAYTLLVLNGNEAISTALLAAFVVGVGTGSLLCERMSGRRIELGWCHLAQLDSACLLSISTSRKRYQHRSGFLDQRFPGSPRQHSRAV